VKASSGYNRDLREKEEKSIEEEKKEMSVLPQFRSSRWGGGTHPTFRYPGIERRRGGDGGGKGKGMPVYFSGENR